MIPTLKTLVATSIVALMAGFSVPTAANALDAAQKAEIGAYIKEYLIQNPEVIAEAQQALEQKQEEARSTMARQAVTANKNEIFEAKDDITLGNPKGDVTVVEFFDYNCGYCRHQLSSMNDIITNDKNVRFVLKEWPILGPNSIATHKVANAVRELAPEKYKDFHYAIMSSQTMATEDSAIETAETLGLKEQDIRKMMASKPNDDLVAQTDQLARNLGFTGTPGYVFKDEAVNGAVPTSTLTEKIANVRACGKATCS